MATMEKTRPPRRCHYLQPNHGDAIPRNWVFVDTETQSTRVGNETSLTLKMGVACAVLLSPSLDMIHARYLTFTDTANFWEWSLAQVETDRRTILSAYNLAFDIRILDGFRELATRGYTSSVPYVHGTTTILRWKRGKHTIHGLDATNWYEGKLADLGETLGLEKLPIDFDTSSPTALETYCRRDVDIVRDLMLWWLRFIREHDLGVFGVTKSSQAFNAFRHRFMDTRILIHVNPDVAELERRSYVGGRVECRRLGKLTDGPYYKLDVNSHYPAIMRDHPLPYRLAHVAETCTLDELRDELATNDVIADVDLETDTPLYPTRRDGRLVFPVGTFSTTLAASELRVALDRGDIRRVSYAASYRTTVLFSRFVEYFYALKRSYTERGDLIRAKMVKYLLNGLSGKWGQRSVIWEESTRDRFDLDGETLIFSQDYDGSRTRIVLCDQVWEEVGKEESYNAFPAICAAITSEGRVRLSSLMLRAGLEHCLYTDTDSVIVDSVGYERLKAQIDPTALGALKLEGKSERLTIHGPKWYEFGEDLKIKGIPEKREEIDTDTWRVDSWEGLRGWLSKGEHGVVKIRAIQKHLSRNYSKGTVDSSGSVSPPRLSEIAR